MHEHPDAESQSEHGPQQRHHEGTVPVSPPQSDSPHATQVQPAHPASVSGQQPGRGSFGETHPVNLGVNVPQSSVAEGDTVSLAEHLPTHHSTLSEQQPPQHRPSGLFTGLIVGALVGALVGGGTAAIVTSNTTGNTENAATASQITIANPETATQVSAIAAVATPSTVTIEVSSRAGSGTGSGVIYSADGYIITNAHVVTMQGASFANTTVRVELSDGRILNGTIVGSDPYADIAVVKVEASGLTPIQVSDTDVAVGDLTVAIGAPFNLSNTVTSGVVSTLNRGITVGSPLVPEDDTTEDAPSGDNPFEFWFDAPGDSPQTTGGQVTLPVIQTDASINPGNSGGPLLNAAGELIGINVAIASAGQNESEAGSVGLGFAIPASLATRVADSIIAGETPSHGLLGATVLDARASQTATQRGGLVRDVIPGSAAEQAGIQAGDIITEVNGVPTGDGTSVSAMIRYFEGGSDVTLKVVRGDETLTKEVTLGTMSL